MSGLVAPARIASATGVPSSFDAETTQQKRKTRGNTAMGRREGRRSQTVN
jgi:hypothetical protein